MINELKKNPATYPYPHKFVVQITVPEFIAKYESLCKEGEFLEEVISLAARVTNIRVQGKNLVFYDLKGDGKRLQVMCNINNHKGAQTFAEVHSKFRRGDIIGVVGTPGKTKRGELSIAPGEVVLLSPCLHMLP
jgi:lysyl-tRNA synthetase class 2